MTTELIASPYRVMERQETSINVRVPIFDDLFKQALAEYNQTHQDRPATRFLTMYQIGYVQTKDGRVFVFDTEGCGIADPITEKIPAEIDLYPEFGDQVFTPISPTFTARIGPKELLSLPTEPEPIELSRFIRMFGRRLESNFGKWRDKLSPFV